MGNGGLSEALGNGLDDEQNHALARCADPRRIVELVLGGLRARPGLE